MIAIAGHPAQWPMALSHPSAVMAAAASLPTSTALSKPLLLKFGHSQQSILSAASNPPAIQEALSSMPLISTVIALPSLPNGVRVRLHFQWHFRFVGGLDGTCTGLCRLLLPSFWATIITAVPKLI